MIKLKDISKYYGDKKILEFKNIEIQENEKIGIVGINGSGKTTLLNIIARKINPDRGIVEVNGSIAYIKQLDDIATNRKSKKSGGEKMLENINKALEKNINIILADEPSTNLDLSHIEYLIKKFKQYQGTLVIISHDRQILDALCDKIIEIDNGNVQIYKGNYTEYKKQKEQNLNRKMFEYESYIKERTRLEKAIVKSKQESKAVRKAPKRMGNSEARLHKREATEIKEKLEKHSNALQTRLGQLEVKEKPKTEYRIDFKTQENNEIKSKFAIQSDNISLKIEQKELINNSKFYIQSNKTTVIIGDNGTGKTTLIKHIINEDSQIRINPQIKIGYFRQNLDNLNEEETVLENVKKDSIQDEITIKNVLANLFIRDRDLYKQVRVLSGGEKVKVAIAKILLSNANCIILDEPTNFLDIESIEALEKLIKQYNGTVIVVSHDRKFIDNIADSIIVIKNKKMKQFDGNYTQYMEMLKSKNKQSTNDKILLEFKIAKLNSEIAMSKDQKEKEILQRQLDEL